MSLKKIKRFFVFGLAVFSIRGTGMMRGARVALGANFVE